MRKIGYARVSTDKQTLLQQLDALKAAGCARIFTDEAVSALAKDRPGLQAARAELGTGDCFCVLAIDRAFRSTIEGILFLDGLHRDGIIFQSIYQHIDTCTPEGRKWFIDAVNNAEYERTVISRRTKEKMEAARRRGQHLGRPCKLTADQVRAAQGRIANGNPIAREAIRLGVSYDTLKRAMDRERLAA